MPSSENVFRLLIATKLASLFIHMVFKQNTSLRTYTNSKRLAENSCVIHSKWWLRNYFTVTAINSTLNINKTTQLSESKISYFVASQRQKKVNLHSSSTLRQMSLHQREFTASQKHRLDWQKLLLHPCTADFRSETKVLPVPVNCPDCEEPAESWCVTSHFILLAATFYLCEKMRQATASEIIVYVSKNWKPIASCQMVLWS